MLFNLFSRESAPLPAASRLAPEVSADTERALLSAALFHVLETLPQSFSGRENIRMLCDVVAAASPHLRFVWVGFTEGLSTTVKPYAYAGPCQFESHDWSLPESCFDHVGPHSEQRPQAGDASTNHGLFAPWQRDPSASSVCSALAAPLRSEKAGLRGMIVFYADQPGYFDSIGLPLMRAFCHVGEIIWKQSNLVRVATQVAQQDPLTSLMGRRHTMTLLDKEIARAERTERPLSILVCRIEGLNKLNDMYGLHATDAVIAAFARGASEQIPAGHLGGRWTGTEFLFIMPGVDHDKAETLAVSVGDHFRNKPINVRNWSIRLALRIGTATYTRHSLGIDDLIMQAHQSLVSASDELPSSAL
jgi:diguanylate cyclase (GGDEF)-like protein